MQWLGWSARGLLLTLGNGKLTGWELPAGKAVFEVDGNYRLPLAAVRGGGWLALGAGAHLDLVDGDTGKCLGRLALPQNNWTSASQRTWRFPATARR